MAKKRNTIYLLVGAAAVAVAAIVLLPKYKPGGGGGPGGTFALYVLSSTLGNNLTVSISVNGTSYTIPGGFANRIVLPYSSGQTITVIAPAYPGTTFNSWAVQYGSVNNHYTTNVASFTLPDGYDATALSVIAVYN